MVCHVSHPLEHDLLLRSVFASRHHRLCKDPKTQRLYSCNCCEGCCLADVIVHLVGKELNSAVPVAHTRPNLLHGMAQHLNVCPKEATH